MTADPLLHVVVQLRSSQELICYMQALTAEVYRICKVTAKCQEGALQDANGMALADDGTELSAGTCFFTQAKPTDMSNLRQSPLLLTFASGNCVKCFRLCQLNCSLR